MTEDHPTYADLDRDPGPGELTYRLTAPTGSSIGLHFPPSDTADILAAFTRQLVYIAFDRSHPETPTDRVAYADYRAEVLTQATLDRIDELERLLEAARNALIDYVAPFTSTDELIDDIEDILGYPETTTPDATPA